MKHSCEEALTMIGDRYIQCGKDAPILVQHRGRTEGLYWMCPEDASHNIHNRNAEDITPKEDEG